MFLFCSNGVYMVKRSSNRNKLDDSAYPIRVKLKVPDNGHGVALDRYNQYLNSHIGPRPICLAQFNDTRWTGFSSLFP